MDHQEELQQGRRIVFFVDEWVFVWGDVCGYVWGKRHERIFVPVSNTRKRQA
jgi:putative transposase